MTFFNWKVVILIILAIIGLLINYQKISDGFLGIFPKTENVGIAFITFSQNHDTKLFQEDKIWGWPFAYWENYQFNLKFLVFDLIFYTIVWLFIIFFIWFLVGMKKLKDRRLKPPKFDL